jgi:hypothetical protein
VCVNVHALCGRCCGMLALCLLVLHHCVRIRQHTPCVSIRQHAPCSLSACSSCIIASAYVSIRQHTSAHMYAACGPVCGREKCGRGVCGSVRLSMRAHTCIYGAFGCVCASGVRIRHGLTSSKSFLSFGSEKTKVDRDIDEFRAPPRIPLLLDLVTSSS